MPGTYSKLLHSQAVSAEEKSVGEWQSLAPAVSISPEEAASPQENRSSERKSERTVFRAENRTVSLPVKRKTKRYSFEFYEDQLIRVSKLKIQAEMSGENISKSEIVRAALDDYLRDKEV